MVGTLSKHWVFTLNNYTAEDVEHLRSFSAAERCKYIIWGREVSDSGTPHLQGYVQFKQRVRLNQVKTFLGSQRLHAERMRGTATQASTYCKKEGDFEEHGDIDTEQGRRTDIERLVEWCRDRTSLPPRHEVIREFPGLAMRGIDRLMDIVNAHVSYAPIVTGEPVLRGWQDDLFGKLEEPASDRVIDFYVDPEGNSGKTFMAQYCLDKLPLCQYLCVGKSADLAHMIDESNRIFFIDVARSQMEFLQYQVLEMLKNRLVFSPKYASRMKRLAFVPHVVVFCNEMPDESKLSVDRFNVVSL